MKWWLVALYAVAGLCEFGGATTVALDLRARRLRRRGYVTRGRDVNIYGPTARGQESVPAAMGSGSVPPLKERVAHLEDLVRGLGDRFLDVTDRVRDDAFAQIQQRAEGAELVAQKQDEQLADLFGVNDADRAAKIGVGLVLVGVLLGTAANIWSAL